MGEPEADQKERVTNDRLGRIAITRILRQELFA